MFVFNKTHGLSSCSSVVVSRSALGGSAAVAVAGGGGGDEDVDNEMDADDGEEDEGGEEEADDAEEEEDEEAGGDEDDDEDDGEGDRDAEEEDDGVAAVVPVEFQLVGGPPGRMGTGGRGDQFPPSSSAVLGTMNFCRIYVTVGGNCRGWLNDYSCLAEEEVREVEGDRVLVYNVVQLQGLQGIFNKKTKRKKNKCWETPVSRRP